MPYERSTHQFDQLLRVALDHDEIKREAREAQIENEDLESTLRQHAAEVWTAATQELEQFNQDENAYLVAARELASLRSQMQTRRQRVEGIPRGRWAIVILSLFVGIFIFGAAVNEAAGWASFGIGAEVVLGISFLLLLRTRDQTANLPEIRDRTQRVDALRQMMTSAEETVRQAVVNRGMLPTLRSFINARLAPSYDTTLEKENAPGLAEVYNPEYEVDTEPKRQLDRLLENMPGGSVGVAGPRGVGKTTLLGAFCGKESTTELKEREVLSVMTSAPVEYDAREFILHIFSSVCQRLLELKHRPAPSYWELLEDQKPPFTLFARIVGWGDTFAFVAAGVILVGATLYLKGGQMGIQEKPISSLGLTFMAIGLLGLLMQAVNMQRRVGFAWRSFVSEPRDPLVMLANQALREIQFQQSFTSGWAGSLNIPVAKASLETTVDASVNLARHQLSLPEVMDAYRDFVGKVSKEYEIIIGIDELDKIGSDDKAQKFLNDIKALFGLEKCFYLISVSESALSSFARRGLPIRDVFDSCFDAIIDVDYFDLRQAQALLRRRVIGVPVPFVAFCHCMAGGLPRDLIREYRKLFAERREAENGNNTLPMLCSALIKKDLESKLHAAAVEARDIGYAPKVRQIFDKVSDLEFSLQSPDELPNRVNTLMASHDELRHIAEAREPSNALEPSDTTNKDDKVSSLAAELAVYLYYCATLQEIFVDRGFDEEAFRNAETSGTFDRLSRARQAFAVSPSIADSTINMVRQSYGMTSGIAGQTTQARA